MGHELGPANACVKENVIKNKICEKNSYTVNVRPCTQHDTLVATPRNFVRVFLNKHKLHNLIKRKFYILITTTIKKHANT